MRAVNLANVDLNLLLVVATTLEERSATRAARKLAVTQSAVSNALRRAREVFGDPLVVREPHGLSPTPRGEQLLPALRAWLDEATRLIGDTEGFVPATTTRLFTIACTDAVAIAVLRPLLALLRVRAPAASLRLTTLDRLIADDGLARGDVDLLLGMPPVIPDAHLSELVFRDPRASIVKRNHPCLRKPFTKRVFAALPQVELALFGTRDETVDRALATHGLERRVRVALPHFASVPYAVLETDGIATIGRRLADVFAAQLPLTVLKPPLALPPVDIKQVWHNRKDGDPAIRFLREIVREAVRRKPHGSVAGAKEQ